MMSNESDGKLIKFRKRGKLEVLIRFPLYFYRVFKNEKSLRNVLIWSKFYLTHL